MARNAQTDRGRTLLLYAAVCLPAVLLLVICLWRAYSEIRLVRAAAIATETSRLRSQATGRASQLETALELHKGSLDWEALRADPLFDGYWRRIGLVDENQLYAAIVDRSGHIVMHTDERLIGTDLGRRWYDYAVHEAGNDIVRLSRSALARQQPAFDIRIPLVVRGTPLADYHQGLDAKWFDTQVAAMQADVLEQWIWVIALAVAVDAAAIAAAVVLARRHRRLEKSIQRASREQAVQLDQIASGLAHEIRNPLHSLRINLYTLKRAFHGGRQPAQEDLDDSIRESNNAIDELERLMRDLLRFSGGDAAQHSEINLAAELQATVNLMQEEMKQKQIDLKVDCPAEPVPVAMDPLRLRQLLQNLLTFAQNNSGTNGRIEVALKCSDGRAEIEIADSGPRLAEAERARLFEPFQVRRQAGTGLGLALVKTFAQEAGGDVVCNNSRPTGNAFRLTLPLLSHSL